MGANLAAAMLFAYILCAYRLQYQALIYILVVIFAPVVDGGSFFFVTAVTFALGMYAKWLRAAS